MGKGKAKEEAARAKEIKVRERVKQTRARPWADALSVKDRIGHQGAHKTN